MNSPVRPTTAFDEALPADDTAPSRQTGRFAFAHGDKPLAGYTIKRGIGCGGFGEIYFATSDGGKEVALKLIQRHLEIELRGIRQCLNLKHVNLLSLYDVRQDEQANWWVIMEYVPGESLEQLLAKHPQGLPVPEALAWLEGIGAAVTYLHDRGIVHRDLKPANLFRDEGVVKVGDYGLSKFISASHRSGHTESIGTVHYMAPEIASGRYGKEIDVYALGVVLYEMLTGRVPFDGESVGEVLMKHLTAMPDLSAVGEPYRGAIARALEKDPSRRATLSEFLSAVRVGVATPAPSLPSARVSPAAVAIVPATLVEPEEPILRLLYRVSRVIGKGWHDLRCSTPLKAAVLLAGMFILLATAGAWMPLALVMFFTYGIYRVLRACVRMIERVFAPPARKIEVNAVSAARTSVAPAASTPATPPAVASRPAWAPPVAAARVFVLKPWGQRVTELVGSLLAGGFAAGTIATVGMILQSYLARLPTPEQAAWLILVSIWATWTLLVMGKFWEGVRGDPAVRRFVSMVVGLLLGLLAWGAATALFVRLSNDSGFPRGPYHLSPAFYSIDGAPLPMAYAATFGTLLLLVRWWRQVDPLRSTRMSLVAVILSMVAAGLIAGAWHFPQPWMVIVAAAVSTSIQLASPWCDPRKAGRPHRVIAKRLES